MGAQKTDPNGRNYDPDAGDNEEPVHEVMLSPFLVGKFEVSQAEWERVMGSNPSQFKGNDLDGGGSLGTVVRRTSWCTAPRPRGGRKTQTRRTSADSEPPAGRFRDRQAAVPARRDFAHGVAEGSCGAGGLTRRSEEGER